MKWNGMSIAETNRNQKRERDSHKQRERERLGALDRKTGRGAVIEEGLNLES